MNVTPTSGSQQNRPQESRAPNFAQTFHRENEKRAVRKKEGFICTRNEAEKLGRRILKKRQDREKEGGVS